MSLDALGQLGLAFLRVGLFGWGGGPSAIPLVKAEVVGRYAFMEEAEFLDVLAVAYTLPGPIATKMAAQVGWKVAGLPGVLVALSGLVAPSAVVLIALAAAIRPHVDHPRVHGLLAGIRPAILGLLAWIVVDAFPSSVGNAAQLVMAVVVLIVLLSGKVHPAWVIAASGLIGAFVFGRR